MPFVTQCPFCGHRAKAPDHSLGASGRCPKCSDYYTLIPAEESAPATGQKDPAPPGAPALPPMPAPVSTRRSAARRARADAAPPAAPRAAATPPPAPPDEAPRTSASPNRPPAGAAAPVPAPRRVEPIVAATLLAGGVALACALFPATNAFAVVLGGLGLLAGLAGAVALAVRPAAAGAAAVVPAAVFVLALFFPDVLPSALRGLAGRSGPSPNEVTAVPLTGRSPDDPALSPEWVDATAAALQRGPLRIQVVSAGLLKAHDASGATLAVRLRVYHFATKARPRTAPGQRPAEEDTGLPRLTDDSGKAYESRSQPILAGGAPRPEPATVAYADQTYLFEAPPVEVKSLRLEIPLNGEGAPSFRFTIPSKMFRPELPRPSADPAAGQAAPLDDR